ncbi:MAG: DTW domain-containing protein [Alphaproteobacteria bacterium]|nr:DTW domain-containing protein [Alphaproteobacteria bacterium]MBU0858304.1 DTW domain-containing protein [Alphaproteobacteria bacterium]
MEPTENCPQCEKPLKLCICAALSPVHNRVQVLILRHPQEQDRVLGTARMTVLQLQNAVLKTGLSWANLSKAWGHPVLDPKKWGVLYLGTMKTAAPLPPRPLTVINRKGEPAAEQDSVLDDIEGIILLDGNWAQAKALWWRNAWMLKCRRLVLQPPRESFYGSLRKEPRKESVSTIEAAAYTLAALDHDDTLAEKILPPFHALLTKARGKKGS